VHAPAAPRAAAPAETPETPRLSSQVTLAFDAGDGESGRVRLSVRGDALRATIVTGTGPEAARMSEELGSLRRALGDRGFTEPRVSIHPATTTPRAESASRPSNSGEDRDRRTTDQDSPNRRARGRSPRERQGRQES
jgi:hypothetical protein